jgi:hypothetical protein
MTGAQGVAVHLKRTDESLHPTTLDRCYRRRVEVSVSLRLGAVDSCVSNMARCRQNVQLKARCNIFQWLCLRPMLARFAEQRMAGMS